MAQIIVTFLFIIIVIVGLFYGWQSFKNWLAILSPEIPSETPERAAPKETPKLRKSPTITPVKPKPFISIETYLISGPKEGEVISEKNEVTFEFKAEVPSEKQSEIKFETKIEGFDENWVLSYSNQRKIKLPGSKEYKFLVRAKVRDFIDETPAIRNFKINVSPFFEKVKIYRTEPQTYYHPSVITLSSFLAQDEKINISGWQIKSNKGSIVIPEGIEKYLDDGSIIKDIFIKSYDTIYFLSGSNSLGYGRNFRLNKCFGYFLNNFNFYPSISKNCPQPKLEQISGFDEYCQEFILKTERCKVPNYSTDLRLSLDLECRTYIDENLNYKGCLKNYSKDKDFLENYWYIYVGYNIVSELHDTLYLRDRDGLLVNKYLY